MKPILFNTQNVRAILDGKKTKTRRVILPPKWSTGTYDDFDIADDGSLETNCESTGCFSTIQPKYHVGDILWVRETWRKTGTIIQPYAYKADEIPLVLVGERGNALTVVYKYKPSIFMPREAARLFLRVTDARAERLQDISEDDMVAEGTRSGSEYLTKSPEDVYPEHDERYSGWIGWNRACFEMMWDSLNAKRGYGWDTNPWVRVITFKQTEKTEVEG